MSESKTGMSIDVGKNRRATKYSRREMLLRVLWIPGQLLFQLTPRTAFAARAALLRIFGAKVGRHVHVYRTARIYIPFNLEIGDEASIGEWALVYSLGPVKIGARATISHQSHLCAGTHDYRDPAMPLERSSITIGSDAWVCADAFVGPGVRVGEGAVVGARGVAVSDVPDQAVVVGNPARTVAERASQ